MPEIVIKSPFTDGPAKKIADFKTNDIIAAYKADYKMDVSGI